MLSLNGLIDLDNAFWILLIQIWFIDNHIIIEKGLFIKKGGFELHLLKKMHLLIN